MANILQGCQKRFVFVVSWFQLMLYPHSCCCFDFWRQLISAVCLLFQFFTLTSFSVGWQCWLDCYSISIFHRKNGTIDFVKIYFLFCFYIFFSTSKNVLNFFFHSSTFLFSRIFIFQNHHDAFFSSFVFLKSFFLFYFFRQNDMLLHR